MEKAFSGKLAFVLVAVLYLVSAGPAITAGCSCPAMGWAPNGLHASAMTGPAAGDCGCARGCCGEHCGHAHFLALLDTVALVPPPGRPAGLPVRADGALELLVWRHFRPPDRA